MTSPSPFTFFEFSPCSVCRTDRHPDMFIRRRRTCRTCSVCRLRQTVPAIAPTFDDLVFLSDLPIDAIFFSQGTETHFEVDIFMNDDMMDLDDDALVKTIFDTIERQTGYRHYQQRIGNPILSNAIVFYGKCIQRLDTHHPLNPNDRRRNVVSMPTYDCRGEITGHIHRDQNWIQLTIDHHQNHQPQPTRRVFLTNEEVDF